MRAVVSHGIKDFKLEDRLIPEVGAHDVLVEVAYCGICGTDVHQYHGTWELNSGCTPGHEVAGVVREVGSSVTRFAPGDRVAMDPGITCQACEYCKSARSHLCKERFGMFHYKGGGFAEYTCVLDRQLYRLPESVPLEWGAFLEPASCCVHGIDRAAIKPGQTVAVLGGGAIGLMLMQLARLAGAAAVILSEPQAKRRQVAEALGVSAAVDPIHHNAVDVIKDLSDGGVDVVVESAGLPITVSQCLEVVKPGGRIVLFGVNDPDTRIEFSPYQVFRKELTILGTLMASDAFPRTLQLIASETLRVQPLISHILPLSEFLKGLQMHENNEGIKILVRPK